MITAEQKAYFQTFGYLVLRQAFSQVEMPGITQEFDKLLDRDRHGQPFSGDKRQVIYGLFEKSDFLMSLLEDARIYDTAQQLLGPGFSWLCSEGNLWVGDTRWHPDGTRLNYPPLKVTMYLDPVTKDTGCLRVIAGSHRLPFHEDLKPAPSMEEPRRFERFGVVGPELPCVPLETQPGDVIFLNMNLWHAAFGGRPGRRQLTMNFLPEPKNEEHVAVMQRNYEHNLNEAKKYQHGPPWPVINDALLHSDSPRIRGLVSKWVELGLR